MATENRIVVAISFETSNAVRMQGRPRAHPSRAAH